MEDRVIFSVDGVDFRWADVEFAARLWGTWEQLEDRTRSGLAAAEAAHVVRPIDRT